MEKCIKMKKTFFKMHVQQPTSNNYKMLHYATKHKEAIYWIIRV